jgi:subtilisin family serine protease
MMMVTLLGSGFAFAAEDDEPLIVGVTNVGEASRALRALGIQVRHEIGVSRAVAVVGNPAALSKLPFVRYVELDPPDAVWTQEDTLEYGVENIDAEVVWGGMAKAVNVIPGQGGLGIKVAVIDTGIDCTHPDLAPGCVYGANFISTAPPFDDYGHGTHVAGIIGARDNGLGFIGVAPEVQLYAVKVLNSVGSGSWSAVAAGIDWAVKNRMHVINMSLGSTSYSQAGTDAVAAAKAAGVLVVSAAGNRGCCNTVNYPAKFPDSMAVAAVDRRDAWASFSSTGPELDVAAPGVSISSAVPTGSCTLCDRSGYKSLSGTSMATPHAAGVGALLMSRNRTNLEARALIDGTAKDVGDPGFDQLSGNGRVDAFLAAHGTPLPSPPPPIDVTPPTVSITFPADGTPVARRSTVTIQAGASDDVGVTRVEFYVDGRLQCSVSTAPYTCAWSVPPANKRTSSLYALAFDAAENAGRSALVTVISQ